MRSAIAIAIASLLIFTAVSLAGDLPCTPVAKIIDYKASLTLTDSQIKKLELVEKTAQAKMVEAKAQAEIRLAEIEKFTSNWTNMNSIAVLSLIKEYYGFMTACKTAEMEAIIRARAILDSTQLNKFQQLVSIESLMLDMEQDLASR